ncbi:MAG: hypothetical protein ACQERE_07935, partial [Pseudomonadota bacterium]
MEITFQAGFIGREDRSEASQNLPQFTVSRLTGQQKNRPARRSAQIYTHKFSRLQANSYRGSDRFGQGHAATANAG